MRRRRREGGRHTPGCGVARPGGGGVVVVFMVGAYMCGWGLVGVGGGGELDSQGAGSCYLG